jgi:hypothetical protein
MVASMTPDSLTLDAARRFLDTLDDLAYDVLLETGIHMQPLPLWQDDWDVPETFPNPGLIAAIRREGVSL